MRCAVLLLGFIASIAPSLRAQDAKIKIEFGTVSTDEIERRLRAGEVENAKREPTLRELFDISGCRGEKLVEQRVKYVKAPNVICTLPGESGSTIVVGGHFDFVDSGKGLLDNWSGLSLLPSLYASLNGKPRRHTFLFIGFADEEKGLIGSRFYVEKMSKDEVKNISAMINLDSLGASATKLETDRGDKKLAAALAVVSSTFKLPLSVVNVHAVGRSDSDSFEDRHIPSLNIHSLTQETFPILHTKRDTMSAIQIGDYYDSYLLVRAYLAYLDEILDREPVVSAGTK